MGRCLCLLDIVTCPLARFTQELEICSTLLYPPKIAKHLLFREDGGGRHKLEYECLNSVPSTHKKRPDGVPVTVSVLREPRSLRLAG